MSSLVKSAEAIEHMRHVGRLTSQLLTVVQPMVKPGVTTRFLDDWCHDYIVNVLQATPILKGYKGYPFTICTSLNHQVCHGLPNNEPLQEGDIMNLDVSIEKNGYHGDSSYMFKIGDVSKLAARLVDVTRDCMVRGILQVKPGRHLGDIGHAIQTYATQHGFSVVQQFCGHGIGQKLHEPPEVLHVGRPNEGLVLEPGMTFTIEPMINAGDYRVRVLKDGWTAITRDYSLSAQWEHTILVTETGASVLTRRDDETDLPI
jgi:methionyl aminopeptidase